MIPGLRGNPWRSVVGWMLFKEFVSWFLVFVIWFRLVLGNIMQECVHIFGLMTGGEIIMSGLGFAALALSARSIICLSRQWFSETS